MALLYTSGPHVAARSCIVGPSLAGGLRLLPGHLACGSCLDIWPAAPAWTPGPTVATLFRLELLLHGRQLFWIFGLRLFLLWLWVGILLPALLIGRWIGNRRLIPLIVGLIGRLIGLLVWLAHILLVRLLIGRLIWLVRGLLIPHDAAKEAGEDCPENQHNEQHHDNADNQRQQRLANNNGQNDQQEEQSTQTAASPPAPGTPVTITISISHLSFLALLTFTIPAYYTLRRIRASITLLFCFVPAALFLIGRLAQGIMLFLDNFLTQLDAFVTDSDPARSLRKVLDLRGAFPTERAAYFIACFSSRAGLQVLTDARNTFITDIDTAGTSNQSLRLVLIFATERTEIGSAKSFVACHLACLLENAIKQRAYRRFPSSRPSGDGRCERR